MRFMVTMWEVLGRQGEDWRSVCFFPSKGEARKMVQGGGVSINKAKVDGIETKTERSMLLNDKYILVQKGKKNYFLVKVE